MRDSGLAHLLSVSGLHIAIVMGVSFAVLRFALALAPPLALRLPGKPVAALGALAVGAGYMLLTGSGVPMQRSFAMAALATLALLTGRRAISMRSLALAAAVVLLLQPAAVLGASFQMSFAAVMAIIAGWEWLRPRLPAPERRWRRRLALAVFGTVATSVLAGAATTPFGLHHFGRLQLYGVVANAAAVPLTSALIMPAGMAAVALMPLGLERLALAPMGWGVEGVLAVAHAVAAWPGAALPAAPIPAAALCVVAFGMAWLCLWRGRWRLLGAPLIAAGFAAGAAQRPPDILVSADAKLIALRAGEDLFLQRLSGASSQTRGAWLRLHALEAAAPLPPRPGRLARGRRGDLRGGHLHAAAVSGRPRGRAPPRRSAGRGLRRRGVGGLGRAGAGPLLRARGGPLLRVARRRPRGVVGTGGVARAERPGGARRAPLGAPDPGAPQRGVPRGAAAARARSGIAPPAQYFRTSPTSRPCTLTRSGPKMRVS